MSKICLVFAVAVGLSWHTAVLADVGQDGARKSAAELLGVDLQPGRLCEVLQEIDPGETLPIRAIGLFGAGILFDPHMGQCEFDVKPYVFVELAPDGHGVAIPPKIREMFAKPGAVLLLAFTGEIHGKQVLPPDIPELPVNIAFSRRTFGSGYGTQRNRAKLVIHEVLAILPDPPDFGTELENTPPESNPIVLDAAMPRYHSLAWNVSLEGDVVLEVEIVDGVVAEPKLIAGDRLLAVGAIAHVKSWKVAAQRSAKFQITYRYRLELRRKSDPFEPRITMQLPYFVEIVARRNGWF